jgi:aryl-alcohol dehydrogenase-like predicted oxidoreductase
VSDRFELSSGYTISRLVHGGWQFSAGHRLSDETLDDAVDVLMDSAEIGITTFDCADIYTGVEELYGRFLRKWRTTSAAVPLQLHTKFVPDYAALERIDKRYVETIIDRSLSRLGVERLDLVQYYWWRDDVPGLEQTAVWLAELQTAGKIRHLAATNLDVRRLERIEAAGVTLVSNQVQYSLLDRRPEGRLLEHCRSSGMKILGFGSLAGGFLTDRWPGVADPREQASRSMVKYRLIIDEFGGWTAYQALLATLAEIAREHDVALSSVAIRFVLDQPEVAAVITGGTRVGQMRSNADVFRFSLTAADHERIRAHLLAAPGPKGDVFGLERDREGPHGKIMKYDLNR